MKLPFRNREWRAAEGCTPAAHLYGILNELSILDYLM